MCSFHHDGKNSNKKRSKPVVYKCKKKRRYERREEGKTLEDRSQVYIIRLFILFWNLGIKILANKC